MTAIGRSATFRPAMPIERLASALGRVVPASLRPPLRKALERVLDRIAPGRLLCRFPHGETVRVAGENRHITWNPDEYEAFRADVRPGNVVFDVGANLGGYSILFAQWVGSSGRVFAFEPADEARRGLERQAVLNGVRERLSIRAEAVSAASGMAWFAARGAEGGNRCVGDPALGIAVPMTSIDVVCRETGVRPDFIKIDAEGSELDVLRGARETIERSGPALKLYVEMHPHVWPSLGISRADIEAELARQRLRPERIDGNADVWSLEGVCLRLRPCAS